MRDSLVLGRKWSFELQTKTYKGKIMTVNISTLHFHFIHTGLEIILKLLHTKQTIITSKVNQDGRVQYILTVLVQCTS